MTNRFLEEFAWISGKRITERWHFHTYFSTAPFYASSITYTANFHFDP